MRIGILIMLITLGLSFSAEAQETKWHPSSLKGLSFSEFAAYARKTLDVRFFYRDEWIKEFKMGEYPSGYSLKQVLDTLFRGTSVYYFIDSRRNVVLTKDFAVKFSGMHGDTSGSFILPSIAAEKEENRKRTENTITDIGNYADRDKPGKVVISGYVTDKSTGDPLAGVTIVEKNLSAGAVSSVFGYYSLRIPRGIHTLQYSFLGMKEEKVILNIFGDGEINVEMTEVLIPLKETVISAEKKMMFQRFETGIEKINLTSFRLSPSALGETSIINSILLVPGVKSVGEGSAGFNVRGGSADQNLILLYGAPLYNSSHFFGFFSAVNPDIIKDLTLYKGGIPGRFGGRVSSVLEIGTTDGNQKQFKGNAGISPIALHFTVEGPIRQDTVSYILSFRNTYSSWILGMIPFSGLDRSRASFWDMNGKITFNHGKSGKIVAAAYVSHDAFRLGRDSVYRYNSHIVALNWHHLFTRRFISLISLNNSFTGYRISRDSPVQEASVLLHRLNSTGIRADFSWFRDKSEVNFGLDMNLYRVMPGKNIPASDSSLITPRTLKTGRGVEASLYIEDKIDLTRYLSVSTGIRLSSWYSLGPSTAFVYREGFSKSGSTIIDTLDIKPMAVEKMYLGPEPRVSLNFRTSDHSSLKINYNRTRQYIHLLSNTTSIAPTDLWKLSDYNVRPQSGDQVALGFYRMFEKSSVETSVEVYFKWLRDMADFKGGANLVMNERIQEEVVNVRGKAYGVELLVKKTEGKLRFNLGYSFSRILIRSPLTPREEVINDGKWFPANYDKPHDLSLTVNYILTRRFSFAADYNWSTGRPVTFPVATYILYNDVLVHYSDRNKYRLPDYSRLDLSMKIGGNLRVRQIAHLSWTFTVFNVLGRHNVYSIFFRKEADLYKGYKLSVFARAIPSVTLNLDF